MKYKNHMIIFLIIILLSSTIFLSRELLKKFTYMHHFITQHENTVYWEYTWDREDWMYNIVISADKPFSLLIWFNLHIPLLQYTWSDPYWYIQSQWNKVIISTYLADQKHIFWFIPIWTTKDKISIQSNIEDQSLTPDISYPPHRRQRLWFFS